VFEYNLTTTCWQNISDYYYSIETDNNQRYVEMDNEYYLRFGRWLEKEFNIIDVSWHGRSFVRFTTESDLVRFKLTWS